MSDSVCCIVVVSLWLPLTHDIVSQRWFNLPNSMLYFMVPALAFICIWQLFTALNNHLAVRAYLYGIGLFIVSAVGFSVSTFPYIVPFGITYTDAAAPDSSLKFLLVGTVFLLPMVIAYSGYAYWVFRGKLKHDGGYH